MDGYVEWLKQRSVPLLEAGGVPWRLYQNSLVPASLKPEPVELDSKEVRELLRRSGALFLRYFTRTFDQPTEFWYTECIQYCFERLSSGTRRKIRRSHEQCNVRRIDATWLAESGYECYAAAFDRYKNAQPMPEAAFRRICLESVGGPFEYWGAFVGERLAGFTKCVVGCDHVAFVVLKLHPAFLGYLSAYALRDTVLKTYVAEQSKAACSGFRAIAHKTETHDFLLKFGYRRVYCDLRVFYRPAVGAMVKFLYPFRTVLDRAPDVPLAWKAKVLLAQEAIRRSFDKSA